MRGRAGTLVGSMDQPSHQFLDIARLLEASQPRPRQSWFWYGVAGFAFVILTSSWAAKGTQETQLIVRLLGFLVMLGLFVVMIVINMRSVKEQRAETQRIEAIEELVQLRKWDQAAMMLDGMLSRPTRTMGARLQALVYLASVLGRYHRFEDAIAVQDYLLEHAQFDPATGHGLRLMRAMALVHEDHLFDADKAISELRRENAESAGLALVEMYRDVRTGHPAEALDIFNTRLPQLRAQLGMRVADAYGLAARCHDLLSQEAEAAAAFAKATLLAPAVELFRRYPELAAMKDKYKATEAPKELSAMYSPAADHQGPASEILPGQARWT